MADEDRILTVPNVLSIIRLCFVPVFVWALFGANDRYLAAWILAILAVSDGLDGYIARHFHQVTKFGQAFDPIADRIFLITAITCIAIDGSMPTWLIVVIAVRELLVSAGTIVASAVGVPRFAVHWFGKAGTFALMMTVPFFLVAASDASWHSVAKPCGYITAAAAIIFGYTALAIYIRRWVLGYRAVHAGAD
jgi:cardiolipin synthase